MTQGFSQRWRQIIHHLEAQLGADALPGPCTWFLAGLRDSLAVDQRSGFLPYSPLHGAAHNMASGFPESEETESSCISLLGCRNKIPPDLVALKSRNLFSHNSGDQKSGRFSRLEDQSVSKLTFIQSLSPWLADDRLLTVSSHAWSSGCFVCVLISS